MGRGRGGPAEIFPRFYFCAQQLWDMRGVLVDPRAAQGQPSKCLWEGRRGIIGQHASIRASHHDIAYRHVAYQRDTLTSNYYHYLLSNSGWI